MKDKLNKYFICFMLYSIIGWLYEVFLEVVIYKWGFSNRGVLFGPYCPVYGFGALTFIFLLSKLKNHKIKIGKLNITPIFVFLGIIFIATTMELITSYILEIFNGKWLWDYSSYNFNFEGRIALNPSIRFGLGGLLFMYILQPLFDKILKKIGSKKTSLIATVFFIIIFCDCLYTFIFKKLFLAFSII